MGFDIVQLNGISIDNLGRTYVKNTPPSDIDDVITVSNELNQKIDGFEYSRDTYLIPNKWTLRLDHLSIGSESFENRSSKITLYSCPSGVVNSNAEEIGTIYTNGFSIKEDLDEVVTGDDLLAIVMECRRLDMGKREVYGNWKGHLYLDNFTEHDSGTSNNVGSTWLEDDSKSWSVDEHQDRYVTINSGSCLQILSGTPTYLYFSGNTDIETEENNYKIVSF